MAKRKSPSELAAELAASTAAARDYHAEARKLLKKGAVSVPELAKALGLPESLAQALVNDIAHGGHNVVTAGERYTITSNMPSAKIYGPHMTLDTDADGWIAFGACGDTHLASRYERLDVLEELYDEYARAGLHHVFHTGNWIDGEHPRNAPSHELLAHGVTGQCEYLAAHYPRRDGITTYAVAGDDHEGWFAQREGLDIGKTAEDTMRRAGREDWVNMGYQAAHVELRNAKTGKSCVMLVEHPGGGSSYADSYSIQKIIESLDGGEKPAIALFGHYHKLMMGEYRGCWYFQTGCTKDRDSFARKKKLRYTRGGWIIRVHLDKSGAIDAIEPRAFRWFNKGYQQDAIGLNPKKAKVGRTP